jgi:hypothetical protein
MAHSEETRQRIKWRLLARTVPTDILIRLQQDPSLKWCPECKQALPLDQFHFLTTRGVHVGYCKPCDSKRRQGFFKRKAADPAWRARWNERSARWRRESWNIEAKRASHQ